MVSKTATQESETPEEVGKDLLHRVFFFVATLLLPFLDSLALMLLWNWFVAPLGVPRLTFWHAAGLVALFLYFTFGRIGVTSQGKWPAKAAAAWRPLALMYGRRLCWLFFGWLVHLAVA